MGRVPAGSRQSGASQAAGTGSTLLPALYVGCIVGSSCVLDSRLHHSSICHQDCCYLHFWILEEREDSVVETCVDIFSLTVEYTALPIRHAVSNLTNRLAVVQQFKLNC